MKSEQFDWLEEIADQTAFATNVGERGQNRQSPLRISPGIMRAKPAHPPVDSPAESTPAPTAAEPIIQPAPVLPRVVTTPEELLALLRSRRDELEITHELIDQLTGWADGYASKVLSPEPIKGLGEKGLGLVLDALALGIARIEIVEDPELAAKMRPRWTKRRRPTMRPRRTRSELSGALLDQRDAEKLPSTTELEHVEPVHRGKESTPGEFPPDA